MDKLPLELVEQVFWSLTIADLFVCKSICRKWQAAANTVLQNWGTLKLVIFQNGGRGDLTNTIFLKKSEKLPISETPGPLRDWCISHQDEYRAFLWMQRLFGMTRLKKIVIDSSVYSDSVIPVINFLVVRNSATLTTLLMDCNQMPFFSDQAAPYPNLRKLVCQTLAPAAAAACPQLQNLTTANHTSIAALNNLPAETMQHLVVKSHRFGSGSYDEIEQFVAALSRLTGLKVLLLMGMYCSFNSEWSEFHDYAFSSLFHNMKDLEDVRIEFRMSDLVTVTQVVRSIVQNCVALKGICLANVLVTDETLASLSKLTELQFLETLKRGNAHNTEITTDGILSLLTGNSRKTLETLEVEMRVAPDEEKIRSELLLMEQERSQVFALDVRGWGCDWNVAIDLDHGKDD